MQSANQMSTGPSIHAPAAIKGIVTMSMLAIVCCPSIMGFTVPSEFSPVWITQL